jgi:hypothetical protein
VFDRDVTAVAWPDSEEDVPAYVLAVMFPNQHPDKDALFRANYPIDNVVDLADQCRKLGIIPDENAEDYYFISDDDRVLELPERWPEDATFLPWRIQDVDFAKLYKAIKDQMQMQAERKASQQLEADAKKKAVPMNKVRATSHPLLALVLTHCRELRAAWQTIPDEDKDEPDTEEEAPQSLPTPVEEVKTVSCPALGPKQPKAAPMMEPASAFLLFGQDGRAVIAAEHPSWTPRQVTEECHRQWEQLTSEEKKPFIDEALALKAEYEAARDEEEAQPRPNAVEDVKIVSRPALSPKPPKAARKADDMDEDEKPVAKDSGPAKRAKLAWMKGEPGDEAKSSWTLMKEHVAAKAGDYKLHPFLGMRAHKPTVVKAAVAAIGDAAVSDARDFKNTLLRQFDHCAAGRDDKGCDTVKVRQGLKDLIRTWSEDWEERIYHQSRVEEVLEREEEYEEYWRKAASAL